MNNKSRKVNLIPQTAIASGGNAVSQIHTATWERGVRLYVTVQAGAVGGGGTDKVLLVAVPPSQIPLFAAPTLTGFAGVNMLTGVSVSANVYMADFYPGAWYPPSGETPGAITTPAGLIGIAGIYLPLEWGCKIVLGAGNSATVTVDAETLP